jgi:hypothetical protein
LGKLKNLGLKEPGFFFPPPGTNEHPALAMNPLERPSPMLLILRQIAQKALVACGTLIVISSKRSRAHLDFRC